MYSAATLHLDFRTHVHPGVHRVQDWLIQNPQANASLEELADISGMSTRNLTRLFRNATGISIKGYMTRLRLELAQTLARDPSLSMEAIAHRCGFSGSRQLRRLRRSAS